MSLVEFYRSDASWREAFNDNRRMYARLSSFVIWSLLAATVMFWALRLAGRAPQAPAYAVAVGTAAPMRGDLSRLFGAAPVVAVAQEAAPEASSRFRLVGVMAPRRGRDDSNAAYGLALIAVDGKPAKAFAVGSTLDSNLVLQSVSMRTASLGPAEGARSVLLELPVLAPPATGVLPVPGAAATAVPTMPALPRAVPPVQLPVAPQLAVPTIQQPMVAVPGMAPPPQPPTDNFRSQ